MLARSVHEALKPLSWLIGKWKAVDSLVSYPTMKPLSYCEELEFISLGQPLLIYTSTTWRPEDNSPIHLESGFLRVKPDTNRIALIAAHGLGLTTMEEGTVVNGTTIEVRSTHIGRMSFVRDPKVTAIQRKYKLNEKGCIDYTLWMETIDTPLTEHLKVVYEKSSILV